MDTNDYITRLEKAAALFLGLLQMSKYFNVQLSSISIVREVACFIQHKADIAVVCSHSFREKANQTRHDYSDNHFNDHSHHMQLIATKIDDTIAIAVKKRRENRINQTTHVQTRSKTKKGKSNKRSSNAAKKKQTIGYADTDEKVDEDDKQEVNLRKEMLLTTKHNEDNNGPEDLTPIPKPDQLSDFQCTYCYKVFIDRRNLKSHLWVHEREKSFQCEVCKKMFLRSHQLTRHRRVHTGEKPYPCPVCGKAFADVSNLNTHKRKEHANHTGLLLRCDQCGKECLTRKDLKLHLADHEEEDLLEKIEDGAPTFQDSLTQRKVTQRLRRVCTGKIQICGNRDAFLCQICGKSLNKRAALLAHMKRHICKKDFRCEFCNKVFLKLRELKTHRREHTGDRPYKCEKCGKGFKSQGTLRSHLGVHSGEQPYSCDVCGRTFSQTSGLNQHKLKHTAEEERMLGSSNTNSQHSCDICGRCYKTKFRLQLHLRSHDSKRDVSCDFCDKKFQTSQDLITHRRSHTKDKYACRVCGASFKSRSVYYFHTHTHQIDRPYLCSTCGKSFINTSDLNAHKRRHTLGCILKKPQEQFICNVCGRIYQMKNSLMLHMKIHQGIFDHPCDFCEKKFKSHAELRHHRRVHTQEKPYVCETCSRRFSRHSTLVNHRRTHSGDRPYMCTACGAAFKLSCTLKKHSKIHTREGRSGKGRQNSGKTKFPTQNSSPQLSTQEPQQLQQQQEVLHHHHLQLPQHSSLPLCEPPILVPFAIPQLMQKAAETLDDSEPNLFIHELKPAVTIIPYNENNTGLIHDGGDISLDARHSTSIIINPQNLSSSMIQQPMREAEPNEIDTARNLIDMRNAVSNPNLYNTGNNTFTAYYYY